MLHTRKHCSSGSLQQQSVRNSPNEHWQASQFLSSAANSARASDTVFVQAGQETAAHSADDEERWQLCTLLQSWEHKWFGCSGGSPAAALLLGADATRSGPHSQHSQRSAVRAVGTAAIGTGAGRSSVRLHDDSEEEDEDALVLAAGAGSHPRFPQLSHCGSGYLPDSAEPSGVYLNAAGCAALGVSGWPQEQAQRSGHNDPFVLHPPAAPAPPPSAAPAPAAQRPRSTHHHQQSAQRHSPATVSPEERSHHREDVPQAKSISLPTDLPAMLAPSRQHTTSGSQGRHNDSGSGSQRTSSALPVDPTSRSTLQTQQRPADTARQQQQQHSDPTSDPSLPALSQGLHTPMLPTPVPMLPSSHSSDQDSNAPLATGNALRPTASPDDANSSTLPLQPPVLGTWVNRQFRMLTNAHHMLLAGVGGNGSNDPPSTHNGSSSNGPASGNPHSQPGSIAHSIAATSLKNSGPSTSTGMRAVRSDQQLGPDAPAMTPFGRASHQGSSTQLQQLEQQGLTSDTLSQHRLQQQQEQPQQQQGGENSWHYDATGQPQQGVQQADVQSQQQPQQLQQPPARPNGASDSGSDAAVEAAWRWRFARRWHAEQARCGLPDQHSGSPADKTEEALAYLNAGGGAGWNMQVAMARTQSTEQSGLMLSVGTQGMGSLLAGEMLLDDGNSFSGAAGHEHTSLARAHAGANAPHAARGGGAGGQGPGPGRGGAQHGHAATANGYGGRGAGAASQQLHHHVMGVQREESATRTVNSLNRRAWQLLQQQEQLEKAADELWNTSVCTGDNWVGQHLPAVEIDDWGTFKFLVVRVRGRNGKQRILVRGRNYCSEGQVLEDINRKMAQVAAQKACTSEMLEWMGGGVMEWRRERDRHLHLHSGFSAVPAAGMVGKPASGQELLNLAAVLAKQQLPVNFKVTIQGN